MDDEIRKIEKDLLKSEITTRENLEKADRINFKCLPDEIVATDQYGFVKENIDSPKKKGNTKDKNKSLIILNEKIELWNKMIADYPIYSTTKYQKLKERTRKGVPDSLRSCIWPKFAEISNYYQEGLYQKYLNEKQQDNDSEIVLLKDLDRTFPNILHFKEKYGLGQRSLYRVLSSYSKMNKSTGYVQGMGFIAAMLLTYMNEETVFFVLHSLMKKYNMEGFYLTGFPELRKTFYIMMSLIRKFLPKVFNKLVEGEVMTSMYASEWFITLFSRELHFDILSRIFDSFLLEGFKIIYRISIALFKLKEKEILNSFEGLIDIMPIIKNIFLGIDVDKLIQVAFSFNFSRKYILECEIEYEKVKNDKKHIIVNLI